MRMLGSLARMLRVFWPGPGSAEVILLIDGVLGVRDNGDRTERPVLDRRYPQCSRDLCALCTICILAPTHVGFVALPGSAFLPGDRIP